LGDSVDRGAWRRTSARRAFGSIIHPDDREDVHRRVRAATSADRPYGLEYRIVWADGTTAWVLERGQQVVGADGAARLHGVIFDVTDASGGQGAAARRPRGGGHDGRRRDRRAGGRDRGAARACPRHPSTCADGIQALTGRRDRRLLRRFGVAHQHGPPRPPTGRSWCRSPTTASAAPIRGAGPGCAIGSMRLTGRSAWPASPAVGRRSPFGSR